MAFDPTEVDMFFQFFQNFRRRTEQVPFYNGEVASMVARSATTVCVDYNHIKRYNRNAASLLCRQDLQSSRQLVLEAFNMFLPEGSPVRGNVTNLQFYNYPISERHESLQDFLDRKPPVEAFELPDGLRTAVCTPAGRMVLQGFVHCLLEGHGEGNSWGGSFDAFDLVIVTLHNGREECRILQRPSAEGSVNRETIRQDFQKLAQILLHRFGVILTPEANTENSPAFFRDLGDDMRMLNIPAHIPSSVHDNSKFTKFICRHLAFLPALSRSNMIFNLMRVYRLLNGDDKIAFAASVDRARRGPGDWRYQVEFYGGLLKNVYDGYHGIPYGDTGIDLLKFQRHFVAHAVDHLEHGNGNRSISTLEAIDYYLAHFYDEFLSKVLHCLIRDLDIGELLEKVWENLHPGYP